MYVLGNFFTIFAISSSLMPALRASRTSSISVVPFLNRNGSIISTLQSSFLSLSRVFVFFLPSSQRQNTTSFFFSMPVLSLGLKLFFARVLLISEECLYLQQEVGFICVKLLSSCLSVLMSSSLTQMLYRCFIFSKSAFASARDKKFLASFFIFYYSFCSRASIIASPNTVFICTGQQLAEAQNSMLFLSIGIPIFSFEFCDSCISSMLSYETIEYSLATMSGILLRCYLRMGEFIIDASFSYWASFSIFLLIRLLPSFKTFFSIELCIQIYIFTYQFVAYFSIIRLIYAFLRNYII